MKTKNTLTIRNLFRLVALGLFSVFFMVSIVACNDSPALPDGPDPGGGGTGTTDPESVTRTVPVLRSSLDSTETAELRFYEDLPNVPYVNVESFYNQFYLVCTELKDGMDCSVDGSRYTLTNISGCSAVFDVDADTIYSDMFDSFALCAYSLQISMDSGVYRDSPFVKVEDEYFDSDVPEPMTLNLGGYGLDLRGDETGVYAPLATVIDIFSTIETYHVVYSGKKIYTADYSGFFVSTPALSADPDFITDVEKDHPEDLADFTYRELCFNIDYFYGQPGREWVHEDLKTMKLDELLTAKYPDIKEMLQSTDFKTFYFGLMHLINGLLYDGGHTTLEVSGLFYGDDDLSELTCDALIKTGMIQKDYGQQFKERLTTITDDYFKCLETRNNAYGDNYYLSQGDTAMIRFDHFVIDGDGWNAFYTGTGERPLKLDYFGEETYDTVGVVLSGLELAKQDSNIKNIIIDMTCNNGGANYAMYAIECLMTGDCNQRIYSRLNQYSVALKAQFDMNFDGSFDENDVSPYTGYNYGVLTTKHDFSCANMFPWFMHGHGAMILGQQSSGGRCSIRITSAAGVEFCCSSSSAIVVLDSGENADFGCPIDADLTVEGENPYVNFYDLGLLSEKMNAFYNAV